MTRIPTILISAMMGLALGLGIAFAQENEFVAAQNSIDDAIVHLQKAQDAQRPNDSSRDLKKMFAVRAVAYLLLARTELQGADAAGLK